MDEGGRQGGWREVRREELVEGLARLAERELGKA